MAAASPYLRQMSLFKDASIVGGFKDLVGFLRESPKERIVPAILALLIPSIIVFIFIIDSKINTAPPYKGAEVLYFESWSFDRTDEEILADRWAVQCKKDKFAEERKESMRELARMSGMDPDEIEREAEARRISRGEVEVARPEGLSC